MNEPLFTKEECSKIIEYTNLLKERRQTPSSNRFVSYSHYTPELNSDTDWIYKRLNSYIESILNVTIIKEVDRIMINKYKIGDGFEKHQDLYFKNQIFNIAVHLNDEYEGGEFTFYDPDFTMSKFVGAAYGFDNVRWHEIKPITKGERWSMIAFYTSENVKAKTKLV
jgi:predicted 2-oxoglutarate/Fe(II)-dependent dioxygenase YbiX